MRRDEARWPDVSSAEPLLADRCTLVVDNVLMSGEVALPRGADTYWSRYSLAAVRRLNTDLLRSDRWLACVLPIGDGVGFGARR